MQKIISYIHKSFHTTPFLGRTIVVLSFFFLIVKQICIFLTYEQLLQGTSEGITLMHYLGYFVSDFFVCLVLLGLVIINTLIKRTVIKIINNIIISIIFFLFVFDIFIMYFFQGRVSIIDISQFIDPSLGSFTGMIIAIVVVVCIICLLFFLMVQSQKFKRNQRRLLLICFSIFGLACFGMGISPDGFRTLPQNIISLNFSAIKENIQGPSETDIPQKYEDFFQEIQGSKKRPNIIVVFAESLSPIDSLRVGKVHNNLPYFDLIQKQGITFTNFITNGGTSDTAHVGLLLGIEPLKLMGRQISSYEGYKAYADTLPEFFSKQGYTPIFISAVDLSFLDQRAFLSGAGFTHIIGEEHFASKKEYVFDSAPDHDLYNKTLETITQQTGSYLAVLQTISFHKTISFNRPYDTPYGSTQEDALRYADKSLFYFYLQLKKAKFFDNGILVIVSDHRKMTPLEPGEKEALGDFWYTKGLATIIGTGITPGTINKNIVQHTDFFYGLKKLVSKGPVMVSKIYNDVFSLNKKRNRALSISRFYNNAYTIVSGSTGAQGKSFDNLSEISSTDPFIYKYLSSYLSFEYGSGSQLSGNNAMTFIAHRGSPKETTENSLSGFLLAKKNGADGIEFDVSRTKDQKNIVIHGANAYSTICGNNLKIRTHTFEWLEKHCPLTNGEPLISLEEMLKAVDGLFKYYFVEIKVDRPEDAEQQTLDAIQIVQDLGMEDKVIFTSYDKTATYILGSYKNIIAGRDMYNLTDLTIIPNMKHQYYLIPKELITETTPQEAGDIGKRLVIYTVNTTGDLEKFYWQGVRIIMTDDVPLLKGRADTHLTK